MSASQWLFSPLGRTWASVTLLPLIHARLRPAASIVRRSSTRSPLVRHKIVLGEPGPQAPSFGQIELCNHIRTFSCPRLTTPASPRLPSASPSAPSRIDLPAPVSPVRAPKPAPNSSSRRSTMTKSRIVRRRSMVGPKIGCSCRTARLRAVRSINRTVQLCRGAALQCSFSRSIAK